MKDRRLQRFHHLGDDLVAVSVAAETRALPLTPAEREVARFAALGLSNKEIARRRGRAVRTVANQVAAILEKLGLSSRAQLGSVVLPEG